MRRTATAARHDRAAAPRRDGRSPHERAPPRTLRLQTPTLSAWVSANAGSGKTHVLTQRVLQAAARRASIPRGSSASPSPRRRPPTWPQRRLQDAGGVDDARRRRRSPRRSSRSARTTAGAARARPRAQTVRARHRDAGRPENPDPPRLLRAAAAAVSRSRPMSPAGFRVIEEREADDLLREARARAPSCAPRPSRELAAAIERIAARRRRRRFRRSARRDAAEARRNRGLRRRRGLSRRGSRRASASSPTKARRRSRPRDAARAAAARSAGGSGRGSSAQGSRPTRSAPRCSSGAAASTATRRRALAIYLEALLHPGRAAAQRCC